MDSCLVGSYIEAKQIEDSVARCHNSIASRSSGELLSPLEKMAAVNVP